MKAALCRAYGPPETVSLADIPSPSPKPGEILVAVQAAGLTVGDARIRGARAPGGMGPMVRLVFGLARPRRPVLGREFAGRVIGCGAGVTRFKVGDAVFGVTDGMKMGAHAAQLVVKAEGLVALRPQSLDPVEAAGFFFGGLTAADFLIDQCALKAGESVLIVGATGAVGSAAVQIARHLGARVTALASADNLDLARDLGAETALDYREKRAQGPFDVILDCPGVLPDPLNLLARGGRLGLVTATLGQMLGAVVRPRRGDKTLRSGVIKETAQAMARLIALHKAGGYTPLIGGEFPFGQIVAAHHKADSGHKRGNLVLILPEDG
jgi:NADPH:quinone reductase-like Zn-dependent oxidoreductase